MLIDFTSKYSETLTKVFYVLIYLSVVNIISFYLKLIELAEEKDYSMFDDFLKAFKVLLIINIILIGIFCVFRFTMNLLFWRLRTPILNNAKHDYKMNMILYTFIFIILIAMSWYVLKTVDEVNIHNHKDKLKTINIIVNIFTFGTIITTLYDYIKFHSHVDSIRNADFLIDDHIASITRNTRSPSVSTSRNRYSSPSMTPDIYVNPYFFEQENY